MFVLRERFVPTATFEEAGDEDGVCYRGESPSRLREVISSLHQKHAMAMADIGCFFPESNPYP